MEARATHLPKKSRLPLFLRPQFHWFKKKENKENTQRLFKKWKYKKENQGEEYLSRQLKKLIFREKKELRNSEFNFFEICWVSLQFRNISRNWRQQSNAPFPDPQVVVHMTVVADSWRNACWAARQIARRLVSSSKRTSVLVWSEDTFSLAQFQNFRLHVWLYLHIDFSVCVRSTFQHSGAALLALLSGGVLGGAAFTLVLCWAVLLGLLLWVLFRFSSSFQWCCLPFPPLGGFSLLFSWVVLLCLLLLWVVVLCPTWWVRCWGVGVFWRVVSGVGVLGGSVLHAWSCDGWLGLVLG